MPLTKNSVITAEIISLSNDGNGVCKVDGMTVFVPSSAPNDIAEIKIIKVLKTHAYGIIQKIITPSPDRRQPTCDIYNKCGGCCFAHITYERELIEKQKFVLDAMCRIGGFKQPELNMQPILPSPQEHMYRNKVQYPLVQTEGEKEVRYGFYAKRSHRVVPCKNCTLQPQILNDIADYCCTLFAKYGIKAYDESTHKGLVRHIYLRHATSTGNVMVCLVINGKKLQFEQEFSAELCSKFPCVKTIVLNVNTQKTNVITGKTCINLVGNGTLDDTLCGVRVALNPLSFFQVNTPSAENLYMYAAKLAQLKSNDILLDLYCGAGTIGLAMNLLQPCKKLIGAEIIPESVESARQNALDCGASNATFICADAAKAAEKLLSDGERPTVVVMDPPRKGCDEATLNAVCKMSPQRIVMISCNPATAARDTKYLCENGYSVMTVLPVDMFPKTNHVETIVLLSKKNT